MDRLGRSPFSPRYVGIIDRGYAVEKMTVMEEEYEEIFVEKLSPEELVEYARYGEPTLVTELASQGLTERLGSTDTRGNTMLHMFAANGFLDCIRIYLQVYPQGIDIQNAEGNSALHWACMTGQLAATQLLMTAGAKVAIENKAERTPICEAHKHQRIEILNFFEDSLGKKDAGCEEPDGQPLSLDDAESRSLEQ